MPVRGDSFPTKDQVADYLEEYARHFRLPVRTGIRVNRLRKHGDRFVVDAGGEQFESENVVIAMANYQEPRTPAFASDLDHSIAQLHSHHYRNPSQLQPGPALIVGLGNSGADIALEVAQTHPTIVSGKEPGHIPWRIETFIARNLLIRLVRFVGHHVLSVGSPIGRKLRPKLLHRATALIRVKPKDLTEAGIERVPRVVGVHNGMPLLADKRTLDVKNVIWCTGYEPGFSWIDLPVFDEHGDPMHNAGVVNSVPGVYFVGLHFLYAMTSASFGGIARDAERIAKAVVARVGRNAAKGIAPLSDLRRQAGGSTEGTSEVNVESISA
jgi:putative flavoprotein involved in K+ transport